MIVATKAKILDAAQEIMLTKGFHAVGLNEILTAVKVPKGSFYHYFPSKEQFGVELIGHYIEQSTARLETFFAPSDADALQKFSDYWGALIGRMTESHCRECCLVVKLGLEVANLSEPMREVLAQGMKTWRMIYMRALQEGRVDGSIRQDVNPTAASALIQDTWQGAMQRMLVERSVGPLRSAATFLHDYLRTRPGTLNEILDDRSNE
ncbi:MAG TPA: TetR family transcriptional regulator C-terminal domain-containing protein [Chthoniobacterales bacterium]